MGYSTCQGWLVCDHCGAFGKKANAYRVRCPYGICPSVITCSECRKKGLHKISYADRQGNTFTHEEKCKPVYEAHKKNPQIPLCDLLVSC